MLPIDITKSEWDCTLEDMNLRLGLRYVRGLRVESGSGILHERQIAAFADIDDLARRVPAIAAYRPLKSLSLRERSSTLPLAFITSAR